MSLVSATKKNRQNKRCYTTCLKDSMATLPETNIAPKNEWLEYYLPIGEAYFQVQTVSFRESN